MPLHALKRPRVLPRGSVPNHLSAIQKRLMLMASAASSRSLTVVLVLAFLVAGEALLAPPDPAVLLSGVAKLVLKSRLRELQSVDVKVQATPAAILGGGVDGVRVTGRGWCTPLRLSCRMLDVRVGRTSIDVPALVGSRRILLRRAARGDATMRFSSADWSNFLRHPLFAKAVADRRTVDPCPEVRLAGSRAAVRPDGVEFSLRWGDDDVIARIYQRRDGRVAAAARADGVAGVASASAMDAQSARAVADWLVGFFEGLVLDLDGCELRFRSLRVVADELELRLGVNVRSFPSLDINF